MAELKENVIGRCVLASRPDVYVHGIISSQRIEDGSIFFDLKEIETDMECEPGDLPRGIAIAADAQAGRCGEDIFFVADGPTITQIFPANSIVRTAGRKVLEFRVSRNTA